MKRNDPDVLEREAKEMLEQAMNGTAEPVAADTQQDLEALAQEAPVESTDTAETQAEEIPGEQESGETEEPDLAAQVAKAEKAMKGAQRKMTQATTEAADLRKQNQVLVESLEGLRSDIADKSEETAKLKSLLEDYPDLAPLVNETTRLQDRLASQEEKVKEEDLKRLQAEQDKLADAHFERIEQAVPGYQEFTQSADWALWLEDQNAQTKNWVEQGSSNDVISVLNTYLSDQGASTPQETTLERAKKVAQPNLPKARKSNTGGDKKTWTVDEIKDMPNEVFLKNQNLILDAYKTGNILRN